MSDIKDWSTQAASNTAAAPDGFPEGMSPASVNNAAREVMAAVRRMYESDGWHDFGNTPTYSSSNGFTISGDVSSDYVTDRRIKLDGTGAMGTVYGTIASVSYSAPDTTVTITADSGTLDATLNQSALSYLAPKAIPAQSDGSVTNAKLADMAQATIKGRASGAGTGVPTDLNATQARTAIGLGSSAILDEGTAAQYRANTADKVLSTDQVWSAAAEVSLSDGASIAVDLNTGINFTVTLGGNRALANPTNEKVGQTGYIRVVQDATGSRTLSFGTDYEFAGGTAPTLTTTANAQDMLFYCVIATNRVLVTSVLDIS